MPPRLWNVCATLIGDYDPVSPRDRAYVLAVATATVRPIERHWLRFDELVALARARGTKCAARR